MGAQESTFYWASSWDGLVNPAQGPGPQLPRQEWGFIRVDVGMEFPDEIWGRGKGGKNSNRSRGVGLLTSY